MSGTESKRPNILLIHSDQHRYDCVGANGHPLLETPNLDRLATAGVNFSHAFTPTAICSPARRSLLTGMWPTRHGVISNPSTEIPHAPRPTDPMITRVLARAGYHLGLVGRIHGEYPSIGGPVLGGSRTEPPDLRPGLPTDWGVHDYICASQYADWRKRQGLPERDVSCGFFGGVDEGITPDQSRLGWEAGQINRLLREYASRRKPFLLRWDMVEPHIPCIPPEPFASMYRPEDIPPWPSFPDPLEGKPYIQRQQWRNWKVEGWGWDRWAPVVARYLGEVSHLDHHIGRVLRELDRLGLGSNTLVIYSTDHGDLGGGHGMMDKHFVMYDDVMRVPLIMRWPEGLPTGEVCDAFVVNEIDLASTLCHAAGAEIPSTFEGQSLLPLIDGEGAPRRADVFGQWQGAQLGLYSQRMVRNREWKYIWNLTDTDELYDLQEDPGEIHNRIRDPSLEEVVWRMRARLITWMRRIDDPILNHWTLTQLERPE